jgi:hypothetical protein
MRHPARGPVSLNPEPPLANVREADKQRPDRDVWLQQDFVRRPRQAEAQPPHHAPGGCRQWLSRNRAGDEPLLPVPALKHHREARHAVIMEVAHVGTMEAVQIDIKKAVARDHEKATEKRIVGRSNRDHRGTVAYPADETIDQIKSPKSTGLQTVAPPP